MSLGCRQIHDYIALPLVPIVQDIGLRGMPIDVPRRAHMILQLDARIASLDKVLREYGIDNADSDRQLGFKLKSMGVPLTQMTEGKTQFKLDAEILGKLNYDWNTKREAVGKPPRFPYLPTVLARSRVAKARENVRALGVCNDGLLRTALKACHTRTARYASAGFGRKNRPGWCPIDRTWGQHGTNLQNISRGCALCGSGPAQCQCAGGGIHIKSLFTAWPGWQLGEWDYAALELRIMAYRIGSDKLIGRLERGDDLHTIHAQLMFPGLEITKRRRTLAKNFIYAVRGAGGNIAVQRVLFKAGEYVELSDVERWRQAIFAEYPEIPEWITETDELLGVQIRARQHKIVRNAFGRPRVLLGHGPLKEALAFEISGTAADIMNFVALRLAYEQPDVMERICMQIHDSFIIHAPREEFDYVMNAVRTEMERVVWHWDRFVTYPAEAKAGDRWSELKAWQS